MREESDEREPYEDEAEEEHDPSVHGEPDELDSTEEEG